MVDDSYEDCSEEGGGYDVGADGVTDIGKDDKEDEEMYKHIVKEVGNYDHFY